MNPKDFEIDMDIASVEYEGVRLYMVRLRQGDQMLLLAGGLSEEEALALAMQNSTEMVAALSTFDTNQTVH